MPRLIWSADNDVIVVIAVNVIDAVSGCTKTPFPRLSASGIISIVRRLTGGIDKDNTIFLPSTICCNNDILIAIAVHVAGIGNLIAKIGTAKGRRNGKIRPGAKMLGEIGAAVVDMYRLP